MSEGISGLIESHASTLHDGCVAMFHPSGQIMSLASERVGERHKHDISSKAAYRYLRERYSDSELFGSRGDHFIETDCGQLVREDHHRYHAAGTFYGSQFSSAAVLIVDGQGPQDGLCACTSIWHGQKGELTLIEMPGAESGHFANRSLGHFYTAVSVLSGFDSIYSEGKTMGLAGHGRPSRYIDFLSEFLKVTERGYNLNPTFNRAVFDRTLAPKYGYWTDEAPATAAWWKRFETVRDPQMRFMGRGDFNQANMDIAYAGQQLLENAMVSLAKYAIELTGESKLCLAGGVALNCLANRKILDELGAGNLFILPAAGDDGQAFGKLLLSLKQECVNHQLPYLAYLGPQYHESEIVSAIDGHSHQVDAVQLPQAELLAEVARRISVGEIVGWWRGRSEFGPRALGHRSILADPRSAELRDHINRHIKRREWFQPLAPVICAEVASEFFDLPGESPFMLLTAAVQDHYRETLAGIVHADGTARIQTVTYEQEPVLYGLLQQFKTLTGLPVLLNTSFNGRDEPIVETAEDAIRSFLELNLDCLVLEDHLVVKC